MFFEHIVNVDCLFLSIFYANLSTEHAEEPYPVFHNKKNIFQKYCLNRALLVFLYLQRDQEIWSEPCCLEEAETQPQRSSPPEHRHRPDTLLSSSPGPR